MTLGLEKVQPMERLFQPLHAESSETGHARFRYPNYVCPDCICAHYVCSMRVEQILPVYRINNAVFQCEFCCQLHPRHGFQAVENKVLFDNTADNAFIAMLACAFAENRVRSNRFPERNIVQRLQPLGHIINVFENYAHDISVPEADSTMQIPDIVWTGFVSERARNRRFSLIQSIPQSIGKEKLS